MGLALEYFFDSYALVELLKGNPHYARYCDARVVITLLNLIELTQQVLRDLDESRAREAYHKFKENVAEPSEEVVLAALRFRLQHKHRRFSYADAVGYTYANHAKIPFLTGDRQFEGFPNVEFVR